MNPVIWLLPSPECLCGRMIVLMAAAKEEVPPPRGSGRLSANGAPEVRRRPLNWLKTGWNTLELEQVMKEIGAFAAKTHLSRLLEEVAAGEEIVISRHGVPLARLVPIDRQLRRKRLAAIERLQGFAAGRRLDGLRIGELRDEGRRW